MHSISGFVMQGDGVGIVEADDRTVEGSQGGGGGGKVAGGLHGGGRGGRASRVGDHGIIAMHSELRRRPTGRTITPKLHCPMASARTNSKDPSSPSPPSARRRPWSATLVITPARCRLERMTCASRRRTRLSPPPSEGREQI